MTTITIAHDELSRLVSIVGPTVGRDQLLPVFTYVHFNSHEGHVQVTATDRFVMARARGKAEMPEGLEFNLTLPDLKHLLSMTRPTFRALLTLTLDVTDDLVTVTTSQDSLVRGSAVKVSYSNREGAFPKYWPASIGNPGGPAAFNPEYLRRVPSFRGEPAVFMSEAGKPSGFFGPDWAIIIMALKAPEEQLTWPSLWLSMVKPEAESTAA